MVLLLAVFLPYLLSLAASDGETHHSRKKRGFDDMTPENSESNQCADGSGLSLDGDSCLPCQAGQYSDNDKCEVCLIGQYNGEESQTSCKDCTPGKTTLEKASQSADACIVACPLPATTVHAQYTLDNLPQADGSNVATGTTVTLMCESEYTFKGESTFTEACASAGFVLENECFKVDASPSVDLYEFTGSEATVTCYGYSSFKPHDIGYTLSGGADFVIAKKDTDDYYDPDRDRDMVRYTVTSSTGLQGEVTCTMQAYNTITEVETSLSKTGFLFFEYVAASSTSTVYVGAAVEISVVVTDLTNALYTWSWTKGSDDYESVTHSDKTGNLKESKTEIASAEFADAAVYTISLSISNQQGVEQLTKVSTATLVVRGFSGQPADENGLTTVTRSEGTEVILTCSFSGELGAEESIKWMKEDKTTDYSDSGGTVSGEQNDPYKSTITFDSWPTGLDNAQAYCMVFDGGIWRFSSDPIQLYSVAYTILISPEADKCGLAESDVELTCKASYPESLTTGPTVSWYKVGDDTAISDGDGYVVSGKKEALVWESVLTVKDASSNDAGSYYCKGIWTEPTYTALTSSSRALTVVGFTDIPIKYAIVGASNVELSTSYTGQQPLSVSWKDGSGNPIENSEYPHTTDHGTASGPYTFALTVPSVSSATITQFDVVVTLRPPCTTDISSTIKKSAILETLWAEITTTATQFQDSEDYVYDGDEVSFTCTYKNPQSLAVPTLNWVATGTDGDINIGTPDRSAAFSEPEGKEVITVTATAAHSGTYKCDCYYPNDIGTASSATRTLHVIGVKPAATVYLGEGGSGKLTCTFTGRSGTVSWAKVGASTDLSSRVTTGLYQDGEITSELSFTDAQEDTDEGQYDCVMTFVGITETKTLQPRLRIMRVTEVSVTPDSRVADSSSGFTLTCKVSWDISDLSYVPVVTWTFTGAGVLAEPLSNQADPFVYTKVSAAPADMGKYECSVDFDGAPSVAENTLYVRSTPTLTLEIEDAAANLVAPSTVILGYAVTFTCTLAGDVTGNVVWYKGSSVISDRHLYEFSDKADTAYGATSTATVKPVADATSGGDYKCKSTYTSDSVATESSPLTLEVLGATGLTSSQQYADKGDDVTLQCDYVELAEDNTPATWTVAGVTTPAPDPNTATTSTVTVSGTTVVNNGVAECKVLYKNSLTNSVSITQYVRAVEFQNIVDSKIYGLKGTTVILSCILYGDELDGDVTWYKDSTEIDASDSLDNKAPATELYEAGEYKTTSTLIILAATVATDRGTYKCEGTRKHDSVKTSQEQDLSIVTMSVTGTTTVNLGGDTTLQCTTDPADDIAASYTWTKQDETIDSQTAASLPLTSAAWDAAAEYKCAVVFKHSLGDMESDPVSVFVQGFVSVVQENMAGLYNEAGETITLKAVIRSQAQPDTFSLTRDAETDPTAITNTPTATQPGGGQDWTVDVEFEAKKVTVAEGEPKNAVYKLSIGTMSGVEFAITLTIYEKCSLPTVESLSELQGGTLDHMGVLSDLTCGDEKAIFGGTGVSCKDGALTWTGTPAQQPKCLDLLVEINPAPQLLKVGGEATLSCSSAATKLTISVITWSSGEGHVEKEDSSPAKAGTTGSVVFSSTLQLVGAAELNAKTYGCKLATASGTEAESTRATVYIVGVKSGVATYPGAYFESDTQSGDFSEAGSIRFEVYSGPGIATATVSFTKEDQSSEVVTFVPGAELDNVVEYTYDPIADAMKVTGTYQIEVTYQDVTAAVGDSVVTVGLLLPVYQFCKIAELVTVTGGTWSPATKVDFRGYATLSCAESGRYIKGIGVAQCLPGSDDTQFPTLDPAPTCDSKDDLPCGTLIPPQHGSVIYKDTNSASYLCDAGYFLVDAQTEYTCNVETWSIVTAANPNGDPPTCQVAIAADSRLAKAELTINVDAELCNDNAGKVLVSLALQSALEVNGILTCIKNFYCTWTDFTCDYDSGTEAITVGFTLKQIAALRDKTLLTADVESINTKGSEVTFEVTSDKKRATVGAEVATASAVTSTACPAGSVEMDGTCSVCPAGYGLSGDTCSQCALAQYSTGGTINPCTACSGDLTTHLTGSTAVSQCISSEAVCIVEGTQEHRTLVPPGGARITPDAYIALTCGEGYNLALNVEPTFKCSLTPYPVCYPLCSLAQYTDEVLKASFIHNTGLVGTVLRHNEKISVTCMTGYEYYEDTPLKIHTCEDGVLPDFGTCVDSVTEESRSGEGGTEVLTTVIVCVIVLGVAVVLLFLFIVVQWRKKKQAAYKIRGRKEFMDPIENLGAIEEAEEGANVHLKKVSLKLSEADKKAPLMSRPVHISDFSKYYDLLSRNDDRELKQEFTTFDSFDDNNTSYHGSIPDNDGKNRYKNIIPFDHSRVKLSIINDDGHSDYINASYIHGYHKPRVYIATQAPLYETLEDFWRMVWEKKSTMIVNLTKVEENGKIKSVVYWPSVEERSKQYGTVSVTRVDKQDSEFFVVYSFEIRHKLEEGCREVFMFNYVGWPDFDVPTRTVEFVNFIYNIRHLLFIRPPMGPIVCHCSAGTGRTGAYIGIMNTLDRLINKEDLDILGLVGSLRQQRRKMVFTSTQYKFLHRVMLDVVTNDNFDLLKQSGFRKKIDVPGVALENPYVSTSESDELDDLNDTKV